MATSFPPIPNGGFFCPSIIWVEDQSFVGGPGSDGQWYLGDNSGSAFVPFITINRTGPVITLPSLTISSGQLLLPNGTAALPSVAGGNFSSTGLWWEAGPKLHLTTAGVSTQGITIDGSGNVGIGTTSPGALLDSELGTITTQNPAIKVGGTWNAAGVTFTGILANFIDTASASGSLLMDLQAGGASKFSVKKNGEVALGGAIFAGNTGSLSLPVSGILYFNAGVVLRAENAGVATMLDGPQTGFGRLNFGGATASFPALKRNGSQLDVRLADDSAFGTVNGTINAPVGTNYLLGGVLLVSSSAPTISSGFGTLPSIVSSNGTKTFRVNVGGGGVATTGVVGLPIATTGWNCSVVDTTTNIVTRETATTTTSVTVTAASAWTASDVLIFNCDAF